MINKGSTVNNVFPEITIPGSIYKINIYFMVIPTVNRPLLELTQ